MKHDISGIMKTGPVRQIITGLIPGLARGWAGRNILKRIIGTPGDEQLSQEEVVELGGSLAGMSVDMAGAVTDAVERLSPREREKLLAGITGAISTDEASSLLSRWLDILRETYAHNPELLSQHLEEPLRRWIENTDMADVRETLVSASDDITGLAAVINDIMWEYPAKVVLLLSLLPDLGNMLVKILGDSVKRFNELSPDLVGDVMLSLLRKVDGREAGHLLNQVCELVRKIHTGSALIGEPGNPLFPQELRRLLNETLDELEAEKFFDARVWLAEGRKTVQQAMDDLVEEKKLFPRAVRCRAEVSNQELYAGNYRLQVLERLSDEEMAMLGDSWAESIDLQAMVDLFNGTLVFLNRMHAVDGELGQKTLATLSSRVDMYELEEAIGWMAGDISTGLRPVGRAVVPGLVNCLCDMLEPADDEFEEEAARARARLHNLLVKEEAEK